MEVILRRFFHLSVSSIRIIGVWRNYNDRKCKTYSYEISRVSDALEHGEGPHWDCDTGSLYFVDMFKSVVYRLKDKQITHQTIKKTPCVSAITPIKGSADDKFVIVCGKTLRILKWNGKDNESGIVNYDKAIVKDLEPQKKKNQGNDAKADSLGRYWVGTLTRNDDLTVTEKGGALYTISSGGASADAKIQTKLRHLVISNGLVWNKDNTKFYFIDSALRNILLFDFLLETGNLSNQRVIFDLLNCKDLAVNCIADGMTIDEGGNLWVAILGGKCVLRLDGNSGEILEKIEMPVTGVTSVVFGGENLGDLYVTTSRLNYNEEMLKREPLAGCCFLIKFTKTFMNEVSSSLPMGMPMHKFII